MSIQAPPEPGRKWRPAPEELVRAFAATVQSLPGVESRRMFGYPCAFANGQMFAGLHQENMIIRLPDEERARFLELEGASAFEPMPGRPMREYVVAPPAMITDEGPLRSWMEKALAYARSLPPKPSKSKGSRKSKAGAR